MRPGTKDHILHGSMEMWGIGRAGLASLGLNLQDTGVGREPGKAGDTEGGEREGKKTNRAGKHTLRKQIGFCQGQGLVGQRNLK